MYFLRFKALMVGGLLSLLASSVCAYASLYPRIEDLPRNVDFNTLSNDALNSGVGKWPFLSLFTPTSQGRALLDSLGRSDLEEKTLAEVASAIEPGKSTKKGLQTLIKA